MKSAVTALFINLPRTCRPTFLKFRHYTIKTNNKRASFQAARFLSVLNLYVVSYLHAESKTTLAFEESWLWYLFKSRFMFVPDRAAHEK